MPIPHTSPGAGFRSLTLLPEYRSDDNDLIRELYEPCLTRSQLYLRAVGYFTSHGITAAARGIEAFVRGTGSMRLVASPCLEPADQDAIRRGYLAREDASERAVLRALIQVEDAAQRDRLGYLAWLVAEGRLDICLALPSHPDGDFTAGIYHEKMGIFEDAAGDVVAFSGSANETAGGLIDNFETVDVYWSWDDHHGRVARKKANFERLWGRKTNRLRIYPFPEAARRQLLTFNTPGGRTTVPPPAPPPSKWRHQQEAADAFIAKERGILEMATGAGKTRTALMIIERLRREHGVDTAVVSADGNDLLDQWHTQLLGLRARLPGNPSILRHYGGHRQRDGFVLNPRNKILLIPREALPPALRELSPPQGQRTILIHDEVHRLGSPANRAALNGLSNVIRYRLGLSATWERVYDAEGTAFITEHVGPVVFTFGLEDAIRRGILAPFTYYPLEYAPDDNDRERLKNVYGMVSARKAAGEPMAQEQIWTELARVHKTSLAKLPPFEEFIARRPDLLRRCIVFVETREYGGAVLPIIHRYRVDFHTYYADEDAETLAEFARGEIECLVSCHKLSEGIDIKSLETVILFSSARAPLETIQRMGRCLRSDPDNPGKRANVIDFIRTEDQDEADGGQAGDDAPPNADHERRDWLQQLSSIEPEVPA